MKHRIVTAAFIGSLSVGLAGCGGSAGVKPDDVAASLRVPEGQTLTQRLHAVGVQIYGCQVSKSDPARFEWVLKAPEAELFAAVHTKVGKHYAGPSWEGNDGSKVVGSVVAKETPDAGAIPWLLLSAKSTSGTGIFSDVRSIQRLHTLGGNAPAGGCTETQLDQELRTSYSADYLFYR